MNYFQLVLAISSILILFISDGGNGQIYFQNHPDLQNYNESLEILHENFDDWPNMDRIFERWISTSEPTVTFKIPINGSTGSKVLIQIMCRGIDQTPLVQLTMSETLANESTILKSITLQMSSDVGTQLYALMTPTDGEIRISIDNEEKTIVQVYIEAWKSEKEQVADGIVKMALPLQSKPNNELGDALTILHHYLQNHHHHHHHGLYHHHHHQYTDMHGDDALANALEDLVDLIRESRQSSCPFHTHPPTFPPSTQFRTVPSTTLRPTTSRPIATTPRWWPWTWAAPTWGNNHLIETTTEKIIPPRIPFVDVNHVNSPVEAPSLLWPPLVSSINLPNNLSPIM